MHADATSCSSGKVGGAGLMKCMLMQLVVVVVDLGRRGWTNEIHAAMGEFRTLAHTELTRDTVIHSGSHFLWRFDFGW